MGGTPGVRCLNAAMRGLSIATRPSANTTSSRLLHPVSTRLRLMATETPLADITRSIDYELPTLVELPEPKGFEAPPSHVPLTIHSFPQLEPLRLEAWSASHLYLPLRQDLVHSAVIFEADAARQGTASTKTRWEVRGSGRKLYRQKGTGRARVGDKNSPLRRGGGVSHGPKPRDFSTDLNRKVYDRAWRTALSYRYRRGELVVVDGADAVAEVAAAAEAELVTAAAGLDLPPLPPQLANLLRLSADPAALRAALDPAAAEYSALAGSGLTAKQLAADAAALRTSYLRRHLAELLAAVGWGTRQGRTTFVTAARRDRLFDAAEALALSSRSNWVRGRMGETAARRRKLALARRKTDVPDAAAVTVDHADVRQILKGARLVVERDALAQLLDMHQSDLVSRIWFGGVPPKRPGVAGTVVVA